LFGIVAVSASMLAFAVDAAPFKLRISGDSPENALDIIMMKEFAKNLKAKLGDEFEFELFHTGALGDEVVHMQQVRTGQIDVYAMGSDAVSLDKSWSVFDMPFLFKDRTQVAKVLDGEIGQKLTASMRKTSGLEVLGFGEIGFRQITNNVRPITTPADFKGMKLRVPGSATRALMFKTYGANPVNMPFGEVYLALQSGTVDGQENPLADIVARSLQEVQKNISISNHVYTPVTMVMNLKKFESLSPEQQKAAKEAALEAAKTVREMGAEKDIVLMKQLKDSGKIAINEIDVASFKKASAPLYDAIGKIAGEELSKSVLTAVQ
jgi:tripartite ATP-independent transporter DctP family solute receptor